MDALTDGQLAALAGLLGGIVLGLAARRGRFCTLGAIEDYLYGKSDLRLRMWGLALAVAMTGSFAASALGLLDMSATVYLSRAWQPLASILGGLMFGYGMAIAGNCGYGALARLGGGDMRSFVIVLVMAVSAYMAISGPTAYLRVWLFPDTPALPAATGFAHLAERTFGIRAELVGIAAGIALAAAMLASRTFRRDRSKTAWAVAVGLAIVSGWVATHHIATTGFDDIRVVSHTFAAPLGETLLYAMTATGNSLDFGIGSVIGVLIGAFAGSISGHGFRWEACEDPRELRRHILGAFLMGTGAVLAVGCSIGQGMSGFSLLAFSAPVTLAAIFIGAAIGLRQLIGGAHGAFFFWVPLRR